MEEERVTREDSASLGGAVNDLLHEVGTLVRQEMELAKRELAEKAQRAKGGAIRLGAGSAFALVAVFALTLAAIQGLSLPLDNYMSRPIATFSSAVIVGAVLAGAGYALLRAGAKRLSPSEWVPRKTVESIKEDARWARRRI